jgi:RNA polymerase sigma-70 factor (ECF subfamily)
MAQEALLDTLMALQPALQLTAEKLLRSEADAEDTVQETVIDLWQRRNELEHVRDLRAYAMQSLKNRCISFLRKRHDIATDRIELFDAVDDDAIREEVALTEERAARLDTMMAQLPERQREAVTMRYIEGVSHEEMQRRLGMTSTNVYTTLSRAISTLKSMIK